MEREDRIAGCIPLEADGVTETSIPPCKQSSQSQRSVKSVTGLCETLHDKPIKGTIDLACIVSRHRRVATIRTHKDGTHSLLTTTATATATVTATATTSFSAWSCFVDSNRTLSDAMQI